METFTGDWCKISPKEPCRLRVLKEVTSERWTQAKTVRPRKNLESSSPISWVRRRLMRAPGDKCIAGRCEAPRSRSPLCSCGLDLFAAAVIYVFTKGPFLFLSNNQRREEKSETGERAGAAVDSGLRGEGVADPSATAALHESPSPGDAAEGFGLMCNCENKEQGKNSGK